MHTRTAFLALLRETVLLLSYHISHDNGLEEIAELNFRQALKDAILDLDMQGRIMPVMPASQVGSSPLPRIARHPLVTKQEYLFVYLYENARLIFSGSALTQLNDIANRMLLSPAKRAGEQLKDTNWQIAMLLYQQFQVVTEAHRNTLTDILFGYLTNKTNQAEMCQERERIEKTIAPLTIYDYIYYRMTSSALPASNNVVFFDAMMKLMKDRRAENPALQSYDDAFTRICPHFIAEVNALYQALDEETEKDEMKQFVEALHQFDRLVMGIKSEVVASRKAIEQVAARLIVMANDLFDQGKPHSTWRLILGVGLMIIGAGLLIAGLAALFACPLAIAVVGSAAAFNVGIASTVIGGGSLLGGAVSFFKGLLEKSKSEAKHLVDTCYKAGLAAIAP